ncbi:MAG: hypothetical protein ACE5JJ_08580 [Nitrospinota bacterium]
MADLDAIRSEAERFCREISTEHYLGSAGIKEEVDYVSIYERHRLLFSRDAVEEVSRALTSGDGGLPLLREFLVLEPSLRGPCRWPKAAFSLLSDGFCATLRSSKRSFGKCRLKCQRSSVPELELSN